MITTTARNVHQALPEGCRLLRIYGATTDSRNGPVIRFLQPFCTRYQEPRERVVFWPQRDANPFFHLMESLWMLAGRRDLGWLKFFNSNIHRYSDDGKVFHGAYGFRWRSHWEIDQRRIIADSLRRDPQCRRQVLQIWSVEDDLGSTSRDLPCNTHVYFQVSPERNELDMMVCNRSNDMIWGAYGANAVHFSILQEFMAYWAGYEVGEYWQTSFNTHLYVKPHQEMMEQLSDLTRELDIPPRDLPCPYTNGEVTPYPLITSPRTVESWMLDLRHFMGMVQWETIQEPFFREVAIPLYEAWSILKNNHGKTRFDDSMEQTQKCQASDWRKACMEWTERRKLKWTEKHSG